MGKHELLRDEIKHIDIKAHNVVPYVEAMGDMAFQSRNLYESAQIYATMLKEEGCSVILCLAGSLFSAGLKHVVVDLIEHNMVDAIVSTGALMVDQDFFEALGFRHYKGTPFVDDEYLRANRIDRIYDTFIDENDLRVCDETIERIADRIGSGVFSSREFLREMGKYLTEVGTDARSVVKAAYEREVPIFVPAFSDCSAGFGLVAHQWKRPDRHVAIDSVKDFRELTMLKVEAGTTGLFMVGGGVPKNFAQDTVVAAELLGYDVEMHKYTIQITVADERDGGLSGSTLKEAHSWGKVDKAREQMVYAEATLAFPLIAGYAYHQGAYLDRPRRSYARLYDEAKQQVGSTT
ncbi:1,9-bis(guanidino)-5-aza-nonane synthase [Paenibacillus sp.]|uniref:1,9-bis(guanidino)-5-aza-nonane synthase n=1 Tax=Paenibacillus sp. TaxID=58172 RepID=UPI002D565C35|nr:deoxyhypusine synthase [Paenibacillus sp.]HZG58875.1 deoxyhypusine synthase [Paenibacillus sp.]